MAIVGMNGREVAYRAWDKERGVMREVKEISWVTGSITVEPIKGTSEWWDLYDPILFEGMYELMQYTGIKDKSSREIYEGDVVRHASDDGVYKVIFEDGGFYVKSLIEYDFQTINEYPLEVIGNIYDNSELLKG